ncbi:MAG TPA: ferrochelatase [Kofleriaceae bacterium]|jgi:ferrochelatase|nr:ferrochelatase [Kofleriaceae bacterium]
MPHLVSKGYQQVPTGLLLLNLGTPDEPTTPAVRRYLAEFLSDPRVIDINAVGRAVLLHGVILRTRPSKSAEAYQKVWDPKTGSPLLHHSKELAAGVASRLGSSWHVELAMRYGNPSIASALERLAAAAVDRIVMLPLYPQYAASSTATSVARVMELQTAQWDVTPIDIVPAFHADPGFLAAWEEVARPALADAKPDHVLFSFHGLPERQIQKSDPSGNHCLKSATCCDALGPANHRCYRAQCYATARELTARLGISDHTVCFQSRLGRTPWITPHTDVLLDELPKKGVKRLAVMCPAFVADCLETLEEIGIRAKEQFKAAGGEELTLVPSLNATPRWIDAVAAMATRHAARLPVVSS